MMKNSAAPTEKRAVLLRLLLAAAFLVLLLPSRAEAIDTRGSASGAEQRPVRIGYMDYGSFIEKQADGSCTGFGVDYLNKIAGYTDWTYEYVYDTWPNLLTRLKEHDIDFLGTAQKTPGRLEVYDFADIPNGVEQTIIYTRIGNDEIYYNDFEAMNNRRVGLLINSYQTEFFSDYAEKHGFEYTPVYFDSDDEMKSALKQGQIDLVAGGSLALCTDLKVVGKEGADPFYWMTGKGNDALLRQLNAAMAQINNENPYYSTDLMKQYYGKSVVTSQPQFTREEARYVALNRKLRVGLYEDIYPLCRFSERTGKADGILVDIMEMLAEASGFTVEYVPISLTESPEEALAAGRFDVFLPYSAATVQANTSLIFSEPYFKSMMQPIIKDEVIFSKDRDYTVALVSNYEAPSSFTGLLLPSYRPIFFHSIDECLGSVKNGSADMALLDTYYAAYRLNSPFYKDLAEDFGHTLDRPYCFAALRSSRMLIDVLNTAINALDSDRLEDSLAEHTYGASYQFSLEERLYDNLRFFLLLLALFAIVVVFLIILIETQKKAFRKIAAKNRELEVATKVRQSFLSNMSHEIRTPLNGIKGSLDILNSRTGYDKDTMHLLRMSAISAEHLSNLVNDILDMSKLESGRLELRNAFFDTDDFIDNIATIIRPLADQKQMEFVVLRDHNSCQEIECDRNRLAQVCINLLSNSIKYTSDCGVVSFDFRTEAGEGDQAELTIIIRDNGIGMSEEFLKKAFDPFVQETTSDTRNGTGLGLSITKGIITLMGGHFDIASELDKGTLVTVCIRTRWRSRPERPEESSELPAAPPVPKAADAAPLPGAGLRILLAEDNEINRDIARIQAQRFGFEVDEVGDGVQAVTAFSRSAPDYYALILMDIMMPTMDGLEATKRIRSMDRPDAKSIYIVAMTANAYADDVDRSIKSGMNAHLSKPFRVEDLQRIFGDALHTP